VFILKLLFIFFINSALTLFFKKISKYKKIRKIKYIYGQGNQKCKGRKMKDTSEFLVAWTKQLRGEKKQIYFTYKYMIVPHMKRERFGRKY
jgi:hypothetical protein